VSGNCSLRIRAPIVKRSPRLSYHFGSGWRLGRKRHKPGTSRSHRDRNSAVKKSNEIAGPFLMLRTECSKRKVHECTANRTIRMELAGSLSHKQPSRLRRETPARIEDSTRRGTSCRLKTKEQECKGRNVIAATTPSSSVCDTADTTVVVLIVVVVIVMSRASVPLRTYVRGL